MVARSKKVAYFQHLEACLSKYQRAVIVHADFVGSKQLCNIRVALRGTAEVVFGKNTMIRKCLRDLCGRPVRAGQAPRLVIEIRGRPSAARRPE